MVMKSVGFRLNTDGRAEVVNDFKAVGTAGKDAFADVASAAETSADRAGAATDAFTERQLAAYRKQATAAKLAAAGFDARAQFDAAAAAPGNNGQFATVNLDRSSGAARASAAVFEEDARAQAAASEASARAAREQAAAIALADRAQEELAASAMKVRAAIDPMYVAQQRFDAEMTRAETLYRAGALSAREYEQAQQLARDTLSNHAQAVAGNVPALQRLAGAQNLVTASSGQQKAAMQQLNYQLNDIATQFASGTPPMQIFAQQSGQVFQALGLLSAGAVGAGKSVGAAASASDDAGTDIQGLGDQVTGVAEKAAGMGGKMGAVAAFMTGPWGAASIAAAAILTPFIAKLFEGNDQLEKEIANLSENAEKTRIAEQAKQAFALTEAGVIEDVRLLTGELDRQNAALLTNAERLNIRAKQDIEKLEKKRAGALGELDDARRDVEIARISEQAGATGALARAQEKLAAIQARLLGLDTALAAANADRVRTLKDLSAESAKRSGDPIAQINRKYDGPGGLIELAKRYATAEESGNGVLRDRLTELNRLRNLELKTQQDKDRAANSRGAANDNRQFGREVTLPQAEAIVRSIGGVINSTTRSFEKQSWLYNEMLAGRHNGPVAKPGTSAHETGRALDVAYGPGISVASLRKAFRDEGVALKKILDEPGQRVFHIELGKGGQDLKKAADEQREGLLALAKAFDPARAAAEEYAATLKKINAAGLDPGTAQRYRDAALAQFDKAKDAAQAARASAFVLPDVENYRPDQLAADQAIKEQDVADRRRDEYVARFAADQAAALAYSEAELALVGASDSKRQAVLNKLRLTNELLGNGNKLTSDQIADFLAIGARIDANNARLKVQAAAWDEVRGFGTQFVEDVLSPDTWSSWGNAGKTIINELKQEFIKLALLNPLKNMINGNEDLPTLTSAISSIGSMFAGTGVGSNASGTEFWSGGLTYVAENGPEIVNLPAGAKVTPAAQTRRLLTANDAGGRGGNTIIINADRAVLADEVRGWVQQAIDIATVQGGQVGSQVSRLEAEATVARRLGRRW